MMASPSSTPSPRRSTGRATSRSAREDRVAIRKQTEKDAFFQQVRGGLVVGLYNQKEVWPFSATRANPDPRRLPQPRLRRHRVALGRRGRTMAAKFDLNDDSVVVIVGSGAGGGTLGAELALKGVKAVILEAGARHETEDFVNDEWASFTQLAWTDMRTTSGSWRVAKDFANLPAWIVKAVGGSTAHWAGASLRFQEHEFKARTTYGDVRGASLLDWPIGLADLEPYYAKAEDRMGVTRTNGDPGPARQQQLQGLRKGRQGARLPARSIPAAWPSTRSSGTGGRAASRRASASRAASSARNGRPSYAEIPKGEATGKLEVRPKSHVVQDRARRLRQGHGRRLRRQGRQAAAPEGAHRRGRRQLHRESRGSSSTRPPRSSRTGSPTRPARSAATTCGT